MTPTQSALDFSRPLPAEVVSRRDDGIARAAANAGRAWQERALGYVREFIACGNRGPFLCEDVRAFAEARGIAEPPTRRAWGAVMQAAAAGGIVRSAGTMRARSSNGSHKVAWVAA